MLSEEHKVH